MSVAVQADPGPDPVGKGIRMLVDIAVGMADQNQVGPVLEQRRSQSYISEDISAVEVVGTAPGFRTDIQTSWDCFINHCTNERTCYNSLVLDTTTGVGTGDTQ